MNFLINGVSNDLQKSFECFNGTTIFVIFTELFVLLTTFANFPTRDVLCLNDWGLSIVKSTLLGGTRSLLNCHKFLDVPE